MAETKRRRARPDRTEFLNIRITPDLKALLVDEALRDRRTIAATVELALEAWLRAKGVDV